MHNIKLWSPNNKKTNLHKFINQLDKSLNIKNYADLHNWSIKHKNEFWTNVWDFTNFVGEKKGKIFKSAPEFTNNKFFDEVKKEDRKISMATIYNTLKQFTSLGLIREIVVDQNKSLYCNNNKSHYHLYIEDEGKIHDIPTKNINLDIPSIPACLSLHNIDVIVRVRSLKEDQKKN